MSKNIKNLETERFDNTEINEVKETVNPKEIRNKTLKLEGDELLIDLRTEEKHQCYVPGGT